MLNKLNEVNCINNSIILDVEEIGLEARKILSREYGGFIHSVFKHSLNLIISNNLITIFSKKGSEDWYSLNLRNVCSFDKIFNFSDIDEELLILKGRYIFFPNKEILINFGNCKFIYSPRFVNPFFSKKELYKKLVYILEYRKNNLFSFQKGFNGLYDLILNVNLKNEKFIGHNNYIYNKIKRMLHGLKIKDEYLVKDNIEKLIGYGIGLTPSGDDFLYGLVSVFWITSNFFNLNTEEFDILRRNIFFLKQNTNFISQSLLTRALEGKFSEIVHNFLRNIFMENLSVHYLKLSLLRFFTIGYSSGIDILLGICCGIYYLIHDKEKKIENIYYISQYVPNP